MPTSTAHAPRKYKRVRLRTGRRVPEHLYIQLGDQPSDNDIPLGFVKNPTLAQQIVEAFNACAPMTEAELLGSYLQRLKPAPEPTGVQVSDQPFPHHPPEQQGHYHYTSYNCQVCQDPTPIEELNTLESGLKEDVCLSCARHSLKNRKKTEDSGGTPRA